VAETGVDLVVAVHFQLPSREQPVAQQIANRPFPQLRIEGSTEMSHTGKTVPFHPRSALFPINFSGLSPRKPIPCKTPLQLWKHDPFLRLVLSFAIRVAGLAHLIRLEEQNLAQTFIGINARRQGRRV
jgi:hypothetical protein